MKRLLGILFVTLCGILLFGITVSAQDNAGLLIWADGTRAPALQGLVEEFEASFGVPVRVQEIAMGDIRNNINIAGPAGEGPDVFIAANDWLGELLKNGTVVPINLGSKADQFTPVSLELFTADGVLYGMPYAVENVAFFRNTDLVPEAPQTWDEVRSITEELVSSGASKYGYMIQTNDPYHFYPLMSAFGGYVFGRDASGAYNPNDLGIDSPGTIAAGEWLADMVKNGYLVSDVDYDVMHAMFENGDAAMIVSGPWALPRIRTSGVPFAISNIPSGPAGEATPFVGGQGFMISAFSKNQLLAEAFLTEFMATPESMLALYSVDPRPPAFTPALESIDDEAMAQFQAAGASGIPQPAIPEMATVWGAWGNAVQFIILGELDPATAFGNAAAQIRQLIGSLDAMAGVVSIAGDFQAQLGCPGDWQPECENTFMTDNGDGTFSLMTNALTAGDYQVKVTVGGTWDENYGVDGVAGGDNIVFTVPADNAEMTFSYNSETHILTVSAGG